MKQTTLELTMADAVDAYYLITAGAKTLSKKGVNLLSDDDKKRINKLRMKLACYISAC